MKREKIFFAAVIFSLIAGGQIKNFGGNVDFGADGTIGAEYLFQKVPISVFLDVILYLELADAPLNIDLDAGIGARYNF